MYSSAQVLFDAAMQIHATCALVLVASDSGSVSRQGKQQRQLNAEQKKKNKKSERNNGKQQQLTQKYYRLCTAKLLWPDPLAYPLSAPASM